MKKMENEMAKKELFHSVKHCTDALTAIIQAVEAMGWTDDLMAYAKELDKEKEENADGQS